MKTVYQVKSRFKGDFEWLDDHLPFDSLKEAVEYIKTQPKCLEYQVASWDEFETEEEEQDFHDVWNTIIGDFESCLKLEDYTAEELKAELKRRVEEKKAQKAEELKKK